MIGRIHSIQSLGAVDGPGLRCVIFMQGCPLRCAYCHNPDTWVYDGGEQMDVQTLLQKVLRFRPYFKNGGGVTVSGGEPLVQAAFVAALFEELRREGVHTALDTSCSLFNTDVERLLHHTDLLLADLKFTTEKAYEQYCRGNLQTVERFLRRAEALKIPLWIRHVVVPGLNDNVEDMRKIKKMAESYDNLEKIEWLPFHNMCIEKYKKLDIPFPLSDTPALSNIQLNELLEQL